MTVTVCVGDVRVQLEGDLPSVTQSVTVAVVVDKRAGTELDLSGINDAVAGPVATSTDW